MRNLLGERRGRLVAVVYLGESQWRCACDCGGSAIVSTSNFSRQKSCGCLKSEVTTNRNFKHGKSGTSEYKIWRKMLGRCHCRSSAGYARYGGRGISVCKRWRSSFVAFLEDMGARPTPRHSIERLNNDRGYTPKNCVWATQREQCNNRRDNILITRGGRTRTLKQWTDELGLKYNTVYMRLRRGMTPHVALR